MGRSLVFMMAAVVGSSWQVGSEARAETYAVDGVHSSVVFRIKHSDLNYVYGLFSGISGTFGIGSDGTFDLAVDVESIHSGNAGRDQHLKSPDFFSARQFPQVTFQASGAKAVDGSNQEVQGQLTLKGVTKPVTVKLETATGTGRRGESRGGVNGSMTIKRSDFNLGAAGGLSDEVTIMISLQGVQQ